MAVTKEKPLTREYLAERLQIIPEQGKFIWASCPRKDFLVGTEAGVKNAYGYRVIKIDQVRYRASHLMILWQTGSLPTEEVDHINGDPFDDRAENLRCVSRVENSKNLKLYSKNKHGAPGIRHRGGLYSVKVGSGKNETSVGSFKTLEEAKVARFWAEKQHGYHDNHGRKESSNGNEES